MAEIRLKFKIKLNSRRKNLPPFLSSPPIQIGPWPLFSFGFPQSLLQEGLSLLAGLTSDRAQIQQSNKYCDEGEQEAKEPIDQKSHAIQGCLERRLT